MAAVRDHPADISWRKNLQASEAGELAMGGCRGQPGASLLRSSATPIATMPHSHSRYLSFEA